MYNNISLGKVIDYMLIKQQIPKDFAHKTWYPLHLQTSLVAGNNKIQNQTHHHTVHNCKLSCNVTFSDIKALLTR